MGKHSDQSCEGSEFHLDGEVVELVQKDDGRLKRLHIMTASGLHSVKVSKYLRMACPTGLKPGDVVHVSGWQTVDRGDGSTKLKAFQLSTLTTNVTRVEQDALARSAVVRSSKPPSILMCQKCLKKGGQTICQALDKALSDRNLSQQVTVKKTGCMKQCKTGPHLLVMPDKAHYSRVHPEMMAMVVEQHIVPHLPKDSAEHPKHQGQSPLVYCHN